VIFTGLTDDWLDQTAQLWHAGWHDAHPPVVPAALTQLRTLENFRDRLVQHQAQCTLAVRDGTLLGFFYVAANELEQFYVAPAARGTGIAAQLMAEAERQLAARYSRIWLACSVGNRRAARFYEKAGWAYVRIETFQAETSAGPFPLDIWRYEKDVSGG